LTEQVKVLHLITELDVGGAQTALLRLLESLDHQRYTPSVACLYNGDGLTARQIRALGVPVFDLGLSAKWRLDGLWRLRGLLSQIRPQILHTWLFHAVLAGRLTSQIAAGMPGRKASDLGSRPALVSSRRSVSLGGAGRELLNRLTCGLDSRVIALSEAARQAEIAGTRVNPDKVITIYNGIDIRPFQAVPAEVRPSLRRSLGIPGEALVIGFTGRLNPVKGLLELLDVLPGLFDGYPQIWLLLVGDGELRADLETRARQLSIAGRVRFTGARQDIPELLSAMDIFVLPSRWEGFSNSVMEAMAGGLPVAAIAVGGIPELVIDGETGLLAPPGEYPQLANLLSRLITDPALRKRLGQAGQRRIAAHFTLEQNVRQTCQVYEDLLQFRRVHP
jgi:glycosyltransferase involved in cell wall biosynthesis